MSAALNRTLGPARSALERASLFSSARCFGTQPPRPPLPSRQPVIETFSETSRPRPYYANHPPYRELPRMKSRWPFVIGALIVGGSAWAAFIIHVRNDEKLSSSVFRSIVRTVKADPQLREVLGEVIRPQPEWWLNGDPYVSGQIGQLQGNIDVSFRIRGPKGSGTLYFTSIRREKGAPYTVRAFISALAKRKQFDLKLSVITAQLLISQIYLLLLFKPVSLIEWKFLCNKPQLLPFSRQWMSGTYIEQLFCKSTTTHIRGLKETTLAYYFNFHPIFGRHFKAMAKNAEQPIQRMNDYWPALILLKAYNCMAYTRLGGVLSFKTARM